MLAGWCPPWTCWAPSPPLWGWWKVWPLSTELMIWLQRLLLPGSPPQTNKWRSRKVSWGCLGTASPKGTQFPNIFHPPKTNLPENRCQRLPHTISLLPLHRRKVCFPPTPPEPHVRLKLVPGVRFSGAPNYRAVLKLWFMGAKKVTPLTFGKSHDLSILYFLQNRTRT